MANDDWILHEKKYENGKIHSALMAVGGRKLEFKADGVHTVGCGGGSEGTAPDTTQPEGRQLSGQQALVNLTAVCLGWLKKRGVLPEGWTADDVKDIEELSTDGSRRCYIVYLDDGKFCICWFGFHFTCDDGENVVTAQGVSEPLQTWANRGRYILEYHAGIGVTPMLVGA